jgi:Tetraacyldisaccharide-1-P 4''-kinase
MKLNTPRWWYRRDRKHGTALRMLLTPAGWIWAAATKRRLAGGTWANVGAPVISIGNLTVGGSGKTPVAMETLRLLRATGVEAHALSRGYGGRLEGPVRVDPATHSAGDVGTSR